MSGAKGSQGDAGGGQEPSPEGNQHATTPPPQNVGIGAYPHQEIERLRNENASVRRKLREVEKSKETAEAANKQLKEQVLATSLEAALRSYELDDKARGRITKLARGDLQVEWGDDGVSFKANADEAVKAALADLGMLPEEKDEKDEKSKDTPAPQTPAQPPAQPPQQQFSQPQQTYGWMGVRPNNGQGVPVQSHPQTPHEFAAQQLAKRRGESAG